MGSGGHCKEMSHCIAGFPKEFKLSYFLVARQDYLTIQKIAEVMEKRLEKYEIIEIIRARKVKQSYFTSIITTTLSLMECFFVFLKIKPDILICNGPGTCIPPAIICYLMQKLKLIKSFPIVFIESICRVKTLSLSGKILYFVADLFIVQWLELKKNYQNANYIGRLI
ncbi:UDP-N-acetylglucosamine transferase subunit ALG14 [Thelohanellus kitauei]|uniref:UDP-N-acetylglucosamine transferase subunit ALG14 n=1 Tax=Thelohanellus kitauei TaxID=669202 RepID=A0A0C2J3L7_THEKT|nr:UDP-N-acetylglucosamine transferase subunit ALG14 [Thelohanellus kitauei]